MDSPDALFTNLVKEDHGLGLCAGIPSVGSNYSGLVAKRVGLGSWNSMKKQSAFRAVNRLIATIKILNHQDCTIQARPTMNFDDIEHGHDPFIAILIMPG